VRGWRRMDRKAEAQEAARQHTSPTFRRSRAGFPVNFAPTAGRRGPGRRGGRGSASVAR
jgi:hypothetical protein